MISATTAALGTLPAGEELEVFADHLEFAAFLACGFIVPGVEVETTFDVNWAAFAEVLLSEFRLASPEGDVDESGFLLFAFLFIHPNAVDGEAEFGDGGTFGSVAQFGVSGEIADQHDFVEIGHGKSEAGGFRPSGPGKT